MSSITAPFFKSWRVLPAPASRCLVGLVALLASLASAPLVGAQEGGGGAADPRLAELDANYINALNALKEELAADAPGSIDAEIARIRAGSEEPTPDLEGEQARLLSLYEEARAKLMGVGAAGDLGGVGGADAGGGSGSLRWPTSISVGTTLDVEVVREDAGEGVFIYRTEHFEFECDARLGVALVREFGRIFEATFAAVNGVPLGLDCKPPGEGYFKTRLFVDEEAYLEAGGPPGSSGVFVYRNGEGMIMIPLASLGVEAVGKGYSLDYGRENPTLVHEITHQVMLEWLGHLPVWFVEGIADYFAAAPYQKGRFRFTGPTRAMRDYLKARRGVWDSGYTMLAPGTLFKISDRQWIAAVGGGGIRNYASADLAVAFFLHGDGDGDGAPVREYLAAIRGGMPEPEAHAKFLVRGRSPEELRDDLARAWRSEGIDLQFTAGEDEDE